MSELSPFQRRVADVLFHLPEADGYALAGGGALILRRVITRETSDLDAFIAALPGQIPEPSMRSPKRSLLPPRASAGPLRPVAGTRRSVGTSSSSARSEPRLTLLLTRHPSNRQGWSAGCRYSHPSTSRRARCLRSSTGSKHVTTPIFMHLPAYWDDKPASRQHWRWTRGFARITSPMPLHESQRSSTTAFRPEPETLRWSRALSRTGRTNCAQRERTRRRAAERFHAPIGVGRDAIPCLRLVTSIRLVIRWVGRASGAVIGSMPRLNSRPDSSAVPMPTRLAPMMSDSIESPPALQEPSSTASAEPFAGRGEQATNPVGGQRLAFQLRKVRRADLLNDVL